MTQLTLLAICGVVLLLAGLTHGTDEHREKRLGDNDFFQARYNAQRQRARQRELQGLLDDKMQRVGKRAGLRNFDSDLYLPEGLDKDFVRRLMTQYFDSLEEQR